MRRFAIVMLLLAGALFAPARSALRAAVINWINPAGGTFSNGANWQGGKAPATTDRAVFDNSAEHVVSFGADASTSGLTIGTEKVTLQLNGNTYSSSDLFGQTEVGTDTTDVAELCVLNGKVSASRVTVGNSSGAQGY